MCRDDAFGCLEDVQELRVQRVGASEGNQATDEDDEQQRARDEGAEPLNREA